MSKKDEELLLRLIEKEEDTLAFFDLKILYALRDPLNKDTVFISWLISDPFEDKFDRYILIEKKTSELNKYVNNEIDYKTFLNFEENDKVFENVFEIIDEYKYADKKSVLDLISSLKEGIMHS